jgi:catechol 2,3-dioxygenase-like lactoylglutathione lyase family enzyme
MAVCELMGESLPEPGRTGAALDDSRRSHPPSGLVSGPIDLDHTSFAVDDALAWARRLRRELGATPVAGEVLAEFRYLLLYVGTSEDGARLELLDPTGAGFLTRFLTRHGAGPHHLTFTVPDLRKTVAGARELGATVVGEDYRHPSWQEAFLVPDAAHGVVVQLAQTDLVYPTPAELLTSPARDTHVFPSSYGASEPLWWTELWDTAPQGSATLGATRLASTDLDRSRSLFGGLLGAVVSEGAESLTASWPSGSIRVHRAERPGVVGMDLAGGPPGGVRIGDAVLG